MLKWGSPKPRIEVVKWSHLGWFGVPLFWETFILFGWLELQHSRWYAWINGSSGRRCLFLLCSCGCLSISVARHLLGSILVSDSNMSLLELYTGKKTPSVYSTSLDLRFPIRFRFQTSKNEDTVQNGLWSMVIQYGQLTNHGIQIILHVYGWPSLKCYHSSFMASPWDRTFGH